MRHWPVWSAGTEMNQPKGDPTHAEQADGAPPRAEARRRVARSVGVGRGLCQPRPSPPQSSGGNAPSANYNIYQGGSNTTYLMMQQLADVFNQAPGCDLAASSGTAQPLDYGCPGLNGEPGTTLSTPQT